MRISSGRSTLTSTAPIPDDELELDEELLDEEEVEEELLDEDELAEELLLDELLELDEDSPPQPPRKSRQHATTAEENLFMLYPPKSDKTQNIYTSGRAALYMGLYTLNGSRIL
jgi:hypothetical protein